MDKLVSPYIVKRFKGRLRTNYGPPVDLTQLPCADLVMAMMLPGCAMLTSPLDDLTYRRGL